MSNRKSKAVQVLRLPDPPAPAIKKGYQPASAPRNPSPPQGGTGAVRPPQPPPPPTPRR
jgi:hypothetical protein